jgi:hypothetical protein
MNETTPIESVESENKLRTNDIEDDNNQTEESFENDGAYADDEIE